jgi:hypothetical protein
MQPWNERPTEIARLLNPAFCSIIIREAVRGFSDQGEDGMPYPLAFLVLPIVLHRSTRNALPNTIATKMHPWIEQHQQVRVDFARRCAAIIEHTREGLIYAAANELLEFSDEAEILIRRKRLRLPNWPNDSEPTSCLDRARFLGRWLSQAGNTATVFAMWGVRP